MIRQLAVTYLVIAGYVSAVHAQDSSSANLGTSIVTSVRGDGQLTDTTKRTSKVALHQTLSLREQTIVTNKNSHLFLACSNGLGIGIDSETEAVFANYTQTPFTAERAKLEFEPSTSEIDIELKSGAISISSEGLSPRSHSLIKTPNGTIRVHSANCRIEQSDTGTTIITFGGNATFYYPNGDQREFISKFSGIRISPQSAALGKIAETLKMAQLDPHKQAFADATHHASKRVHFKAPVGDKPATPVLITPSSYYEAPSARPYEYAE